LPCFFSGPSSDCDYERHGDDDGHARILPLLCHHHRENGRESNCHGADGCVTFSHGCYGHEPYGGGHGSDHENGYAGRLEFRLIRTFGNLTLLATRDDPTTALRGDGDALNDRDCISFRQREYGCEQSF
jgi:hypothetical protein